ncbi:MAG: OmpA family protein [Crocinitomicaceae bacterium]|nr:OmpA family protein [Crocinitomicaceae bacterium]
MKPLNLIKSLTFILPFFVVNFTFSQRTEIEIRRLARTGSEQEILVGSSELLQENYFYLSELLIDKLLQKNPISCNYNYRKGFVTMALNENFEKAIAYLEKAIENTDKNYDMYSSSEKSASTDAFFHLGKCYHLNNQLDLAIETFQKFIQQSERKSPLIVDALLHIEQCKIAKKVLKKPTIFETKMGNIINTKNSEYAPVISLDGKNMYFTSKRQWPDKSNESDKDESTNEYFEDIYFTQKATDSSWNKPKKLSFCLPERNEASVSTSLDERQLFFYNDYTGNGDVFETTIENGDFVNPKTINEENINTMYLESHYYHSIDKKQIYFVSNKPGGFGGRDIYRKTLKNDGIWSEPENLGPSINSPYDEESPFLSFDNTTLYFSSNGKTSMGGYDVFESKISNDKSYSLAQNMGTPINSTCDDLFFSLTADASTAFLSSNRKNGLGEKDIYTFNMNKNTKSAAHLINAQIKSKNSNKIPESFHVIIQCLNCNNSEKDKFSPRMNDGVLIAPLKTCTKYKLSFKIDNYSPVFYEEELLTNCENDYEEIIKTYTIDFDQKMVIPEIKSRNTIQICDTQKIGLNDVKVEITSNYKSEQISLNTNNEGFIFLDFLENRTQNDSIHLLVKTYKDGYFNTTFQLKMSAEREKTMNEIYVLHKNELGQDLAKIVNINSIYYEIGSAEIKNESKVELDKIVQFLNNNTETIIEIGSHTDCKGDAKKNLSLSKQRAETVKQYIQKYCKNPERIISIGYGETQLLSACSCEKKAKKTCTEQDHKQNRRTEFRIIKK